MIVDQADDVAARAAARARREQRHAVVVDHPTWVDARPAAVADTAPAAVSVVPTPTPGLAGLWPTPPSGTPRTARRVLPAEPTAPKTARDFAHATLKEWELGGPADDVAVTISELVTNALRHGLRDMPQPMPAHPIQLVLLGHPRRLVVVVTDPGGSPPEPVAQEPSRFGEGGRGLLVVSAVSDSWGWAPLGTGGKAVWAAFDLRLRRAVPAS
ncbi:ATP-binding protein [Spirillospora sp. CA-294931]|uniref:ATP-binding protein n=1 Tax=Spirillospora sp. CA-294931 TaxID=3240042 RepID=UPI003D8C8499